MQSRNGRPSPPGDTAGGGAVRAQPPDGELTSGNLPEPAGGGDGGPADDEIQVILPAGSGPLPPDRPRPPGPPGPAPPMPGELPRRLADPSRPSVPSRRSRRPATAPGAGPAGQPSRPGPPGEPGLPAPYVRPLPPELFRPLWWQERPGPAAPPQPSPEPGKPEPGQPVPPPSGQRPPAEPSWGTVLATTARLWLRRRLSRTRRSRPGRARWLVLIVAGLVAAALLAVGATLMSG